MSAPRPSYAELEAENMRLRTEREQLSGRLQDAEHAAALYQQHMTRCAIADALDQEDMHKRLGDV
ncbi:MAG TPA: hypothetical protein VFC00_30900 [Micromonosporaceae bacterium]|nr:hypothetical protein [Micromonosporaceae bacterium]